MQSECTHCDQNSTLIVSNSDNHTIGLCDFDFGFELILCSLEDFEDAVYLALIMNICAIIIHIFNILWFYGIDMYVRQF